MWLDNDGRGGAPHRRRQENQSKVPEEPSHKKDGTSGQVKVFRLEQHMRSGCLDKRRRNGVSWWLGLWTKKSPVIGEKSEGKGDMDKLEVVESHPVRTERRRRP